MSHLQTSCFLSTLKESSRGQIFQFESALGFKTALTWYHKESGNIKFKQYFACKHYFRAASSPGWLNLSHRHRHTQIRIMLTEITKPAPNTSIFCPNSISAAFCTNWQHQWPIFLSKILCEPGLVRLAGMNPDIHKHAALVESWHNVTHQMWDKICFTCPSL